MEHADQGVVKPDTTNGFVPQLDVDVPLQAACRAVDRLDGQLDRVAVAPALVEELLRWASVRNAWSSTALEGNPTPLARAAELAQPHARPRNKDEREIRRLLTYYDALKPLRDRAPSLTLEEIASLHATLLEGVVDGPVGAWKRKPNVIAGPQGIVLRPTPPSRVEAELGSLLAWYAGDGQQFHPAVRVGVFFHEFESIHPFADGNGRVGRALCQRLLVAEQLPNVLYAPLDAVITRESDLYYQTLELTNKTGNHYFWAQYFARSLARAYRESIEHTDVGTALDNVPSGAPRALLQHILLSGGREFRSADLQRATGYSRPSVVLGLSKLQEHGAVEAKGNGPTTTYLLRQEYLDRLFERAPGARPR
jgi:Fic family protein